MANWFRTALTTDALRVCNESAFCGQSVLDPRAVLLNTKTTGRFVTTCFKQLFINSSLIGIHDVCVTIYFVFLAHII